MADVERAGRLVVEPCSSTCWRPRWRVNTDLTWSTGPQFDGLTITVRWFDEDGVEHQDRVVMTMRNDKPRHAGSEGRTGVRPRRADSHVESAGLSSIGILYRALRGGPAFAGNGARSVARARDSPQEPQKVGRGRALPCTLMGYFSTHRFYGRPRFSNQRLQAEPVEDATGSCPRRRRVRSRRW